MPLSDNSKELDPQGLGELKLLLNLLDEDGGSSRDLFRFSSSFSNSF